MRPNPRRMGWRGLVSRLFLCFAVLAQLRGVFADCCRSLLFVLGYTHGPIKDCEGERQDDNDIKPVWQNVPGAATVAAKKTDYDVSREPRPDPDGVPQRALCAGALEPRPGSEQHQSQSDGAYQPPGRIKTPPVNDQISRTEGRRQNDLRHWYTVGAGPFAIDLVKPGERHWSERVHNRSGCSNHGHERAPTLEGPQGN